MMISGIEFHAIIGDIFSDVKNLNISEQISCDCPRCMEDGGEAKSKGKKNLEINTRKRLFHCWSCDSPKFSGSLGKLIHLYGSKIDYDLYKSYASIYSTYESEQEEHEYTQVRLPEEFILFSDMDTSNLNHFEAYNYLVNDRKISREIILKYRLGFCIAGKFKNRIIVPSYDEFGNIDYFVGRSWDKRTKQKYMNPENATKDIIFNEGYVNWDSVIILLEGGFDMFSVPNAIPLLGKTIASKLFLKLKEIKPKVLLLLDPDAYKNNIELYHTLQSIYVDCEDRVKIVKLPNNDDIDEIKRKNGFDEVIKNLYSARGLTIDDNFISKLQKPYVKRTEERYESYSQYFSR